MGASSSAVPSPPSIPTITPTVPAQDSLSGQPPSSCPMSGKIASSETSGCPMKSYRNKSVYNVYNQKIDPTNQMPSTANQDPAEGQTGVLTTERVTSSIPKAGTAGTWVYPSPQMFWNALVRKGKSDGASEEDMDTVIAIHNNMNENTWFQVLAWEDLRPPKTPDAGLEPKLLRFLGRPDEYSPKARLKILFGHPAPFDRHDWIVDRGGKEVRYVIDYYHDESAVQMDQRPKHLKDMTALKSIKVDVRPAIDSVDSVIDRCVWMPLVRLQKKTSYDPPPFFMPQMMKSAEEGKANRIKANWKEIETKCVAAKNKMKECSSEEECRTASVALQRCNASVICPHVVEEFDKCIAAKDLEKAGVNYAAMTKCIEMFAIDSRKMMSGESV